MVVLGNSGDLIYCVKQAGEFGMARKQALVAPIVYLADLQAGDYSAALHHMRAVHASGTVEAQPVLAAMRAAPVGDTYA